METEDYLRVLEAERHNFDYLNHRPTADDASWPGHPRSRYKRFWDAGRAVQGAKDTAALTAYFEVLSILEAKK